MGSGNNRRHGEGAEGAWETWEMDRERRIDGAVVEVEHLHLMRRWLEHSDDRMKLTIVLLTLKVLVLLSSTHNVATADRGS